MNMRLKNIAEVQFGSVVKTRAKGDVPCLQVSNITQVGNLDFEKTYYLAEKASADIFLLPSKSIVLPAKGQKFSCALISSSQSEQYAASSSLFVIRIIVDTVIPEYLHWYLNRSKIKWELEAVATGSNISSLSIKELRNLKVRVPDLEIQLKIVELKSMQVKESELIQELSNKRKILIEAITKELIQ